MSICFCVFCVSMLVCLYLGVRCEGPCQCVSVLVSYSVCPSVSVSVYGLCEACGVCVCANKMTEKCMGGAGTNAGIFCDVSAGRGLGVRVAHQFRKRDTNDAVVVPWRRDSPTCLSWCSLGARLHSHCGPTHTPAHALTTLKGVLCF